MPSSLFLDEVGIAAVLSNDYPASSWALFPYPTLTSFALESQARALIVTEMSPFIMAAGCQDDHVEHSDSDTSQLRDALTKRKEKKTISRTSTRLYDDTGCRLPNQIAIRSKKWPQAGGGGQVFVAVWTEYKLNEIDLPPRVAPRFRPPSGIGSRR